MTLQDGGSIRIVADFLPDPATWYDRLVAQVAWDERIRSRKAASFGLPYNYSGTVWPETPFPALLEPVRDRVRDAVGWLPTNCLALWYPDGESALGYHSDSIASLAPGTGIAVVSLGAERAISYRHQVTRAVERYPLPAGSLLWMSEAMQADWKHGVLADPAATGGRISLAFRCMVRGDS
jgi:alkylated DNA repair dioxygenase AlkB